jgi:hypothetical protein
MSGATTGGYAMTRTGMGFQVGHFTVASALGNPSVTIASPTTAATYSTSSTSINLAGTASGTASITKVTWSNSLGGSGTASGTTSWSVNGIALQPGNDVITVTVNDSTGQNAKATLTVVVAPMITSQLTQNILRLSWPTSCLGWVLEAQTNALNVGVGGSWYPVSGSTNGTQYAVTNQPSPSVFYRLRFP